jgi:hypothetical protein
VRWAVALSGTVDKFHRVDNLENCQIVIMQRDGSGKYILMTPLREHGADGGYDSEK